MKITLNPDLRIISFTNDSLFSAFDIEVSRDKLPTLEESQTLYNYKYIDDQFVYSPNLTDVQFKQIIITAVTDAIKTNSAFTHITCFELTNLTVTGNVDIADQTFSMPLMRDDGTKRLVLFSVEVIDGQFVAVLNFPTSGQYIYTNAQANHDLPEQIFTVAPIKIDVLRKTA